jgi:hypothetical protein
MHALKHPTYRVRYQRNKKRLGKQRGAKVAQVDIARRLAHASWHMLTPNQPFAPRGATFRLAGLTAPFGPAPASEHPISPDPPDQQATQT